MEEKRIREKDLDLLSAIHERTLNILHRMDDMNTTLKQATSIEGVARCVAKEKRIQNLEEFKNKASDKITGIEGIGIRITLLENFKRYCVRAFITTVITASVGTPIIYIIKEHLK